MNGSTRPASPQGKLWLISLAHTSLFFLTRPLLYARDNEVVKFEYHLPNSEPLQALPEASPLQCSVQCEVRKIAGFHETFKFHLSLPSVSPKNFCKML